MNLNSLINFIDKDNLITILVVSEIVMSIITLFLYRSDKRRAKKHQWRIKECVLLIFPWLMGGIGGFFGIYALRHKTNHWYFILNNFLALVIQFSLFASVIILM